MRTPLALLLIGCATLPHAPVEREDNHVSSYGSGGGVFIHNVAKTILAQPIPVPGSGGALNGTTGTFTGDITAQHYYTSLTGATGVVFGPASTHGLGFDTSSQSLLFLSGSAEQWRISGATGDLTSSAGIDRNVDTGGIYKSRQASGSNAFQVQTNGARIDFGAGASDYASSDGTTVSFAGPVTVTGNFINTGTIRTGSSYLNANAQVISGGGLAFSGDTYLEGNVTDSAANGATTLTNATAMTAGLDRYITVFTRGAGGANIVSKVASDGSYIGGFAPVNRAVSTTAPTISSGFGTSPSIVSSNGSLSFQINVGTGGVATTGVIGLPTATNGWVCTCEDVTTQSTTVARTRQTGLGTTNTCPIGDFTSADVAGAWVASDKLTCIAVAY